MFWTKKEEKSLPDLPPIKEDFTPMKPEKAEAELPEAPESDEMPENHPLPSFPDSPIKRGFSQTMIKEAVEPEKSFFPEAPEETPFKEEWKPKQFKPKEEQKVGDIFVKIERFNTARKALQNAKEKLDEMDALLKKMRETRTDEEKEFSDWEKEVEAVKSKVEDVTKNIFEKLE